MMIAPDFVGDIAVLAALLFTGWSVFRVDKKLKHSVEAEDEEISQTLKAVREARRDIVAAVSEARAEADRLFDVLRKAEALCAAASTARASLSLEASKSTSLLDELEIAREAADRSCARLAAAVSSAAEVHGKLVPDRILEDEEDSAEKVIANSKNVVLLSRNGQ